MTTTFKFKYGTSTTHCYMMGLKERFCITQKNKAKGGFDFRHSRFHTLRIIQECCCSALERTGSVE